MINKDTELTLENKNENIRARYFEEIEIFNEFLEGRQYDGDSYLDPQQKHRDNTAPEPSPHLVTVPLSLCLSTRHDEYGGWMERMARGLVVRDALGDGPSERYIGCGTRGTVCYRDSSCGGMEVKIRGSACKSRICPQCAKRYSKEASEGVARIVKAMPWSLMITLTIKHGKEDKLKDLLGKLNRSWDCLRRRDLWKSRVEGSIKVIEITHSKENGWHPHLHVIADCRWMPWLELKKAWLEITEDSQSVKIKRIKSSEQAAKYVAKYVCKDQALWSDFVTFEYLKTINGLRLISTTGWCRRFKIIDKPESMSDEETEAEDWVTFGTVDDLFREAENGSFLAKNIIRHLYGNEIAEMSVKKRKKKEPGGAPYDPQTKFF